MLTLYHCVSARSFRPLWMLEELGLPYELSMLPFPPRAARREYLALNALGTVPLLMDGDLRMTESAAICEYLAARHQPNALHVSAGESGYADYLNFLHFGEATLTFPQTLLLRYGRFEPAERRQPQVVEDYRRWFLSRLRTLEPQLATSDFLVCGRFTAADVSVGYALMLAEYQGLQAEFTPAVAAYWQRLLERPAYRRALKIEHEAALAQGIEATPSPLA